MSYHNVCGIRGQVRRMELSKDEAIQLSFATPTEGNSEEKTRPLSWVFSHINDALVQAREADSTRIKDLIEKARQNDNKTRVAARLALIATTGALLLICVFAVASILRV